MKTIESTGERLSIEDREKKAIEACCAKLRDVAKTLAILGRPGTAWSIRRLAREIEG